MYLFFKNVCFYRRLKVTQKMIIVEELLDLFILSMACSVIFSIASPNCFPQFSEQDKEEGVHLVVFGVGDRPYATYVTAYVHPLATRHDDAQDGMHYSFMCPSLFLALGSEKTYGRDHAMCLKSRHEHM